MMEKVKMTKVKLTQKQVNQKLKVNQHPQSLSPYQKPP